MFNNVKVEKVEKVPDENPDLYIKRAENLLQRRNISKNKALNEIDKAIRYSNYDANYIFEKFKLLYFTEEYGKCFKLKKKFGKTLTKDLSQKKFNALKAYYLYSKYKYNGKEIKKINFNQGQSYWRINKKNKRGRFDKNNNYYIEGYDFNTTSYHTPYDFTLINNYLLEFENKMISGNRFGLILDKRGNNYKIFEIDEDTYIIRNFSNNKWKNISRWQNMNQIYKRNNFNKISVIKDEIKYYILVNNSYITKIRRRYDKSDFALAVITDNRPPTILKLKNFKVLKEGKIILTCGKCGQKMRVTKTNKKAKITCPICKTDYTLVLNENKTL